MEPNKQQQDQATQQAQIAAQQQAFVNQAYQAQLMQYQNPYQAYGAAAPYGQPMYGLQQQAAGGYGYNTYAGGAAAAGGIPALSGTATPQQQQQIRLQQLQQNQAMNAADPAVAAAAAAAAAAGGYGEPDTNLFIFHLPPEADENTLNFLFAPFGRLESVKVARNPATSASRGFGFVKFFRTTDAAAALASLNGFAIGNKRLKVSINPRAGFVPPNSQRPG